MVLLIYTKYAWLCHWKTEFISTDIWFDYVTLENEQARPSLLGRASLRYTVTINTKHLILNEKLLDPAL